MENRSDPTHWKRQLWVSTREIQNVISSCDNSTTLIFMLVIHYDPFLLCLSGCTNTLTPIMIALYWFGSLYAISRTFPCIIPIKLLGHMVAGSCLDAYYYWDTCSACGKINTLWPHAGTTVNFRCVFNIPCCIFRGVARIFQRGIQFGEILLTTLTFKTTPIYS